MKKIIISLATLAAISGAALASDRAELPVDGRVAAGAAISASETVPFAVLGSSHSALSAYERVRLQAEINENGGN